MMDCRRRSVVDDDRSRRIRWAVDDDRRQKRWAIDDERSRIAFYQDQVKESLDRIEKTLRSIRKMRMPSATIPTSSSSLLSSASRNHKQIRNQAPVTDDYPPLDLPLKWRNPPDQRLSSNASRNCIVHDSSLLELPLQWRDPPPDCTVLNHPAAIFSDSPLLKHAKSRSDMFARSVSRITACSDSTFDSLSDEATDATIFETHDFDSASTISRDRTAEEHASSTPPHQFDEVTVTLPKRFELDLGILDDGEDREKERRTGSVLYAIIGAVQRKKPTEFASDGSDFRKEEDNRICLQEINNRSRLRFRRSEREMAIIGRGYVYNSFIGNLDLPGIHCGSSLSFPRFELSTEIVFDQTQLLPCDSPHQKLPLLSSIAHNSASDIAATAADGKKMIEMYQKKTQLEHILLRPGTYIGLIEKHTQTLWVYENEEMVPRPVTYVPELYKIFHEILVTAMNNKQRDPSMDSLKVDIDAEANCISIYNNGDGFPVKVQQEENVYVPEMIFGHLLTSSDYDDNVKKTTVGRSRYSAKLTFPQLIEATNGFSTASIIVSEGFGKASKASSPSLLLECRISNRIVLSKYEIPQCFEEFHAHVIRFSFGSEVHVLNTLITMHVKHCYLDDAHKVFGNMPVRDCICSKDGITLAKALAAFTHPNKVEDIYPRRKIFDPGGFNFAQNKKILAG